MDTTGRDIKASCLTLVQVLAAPDAYHQMFMLCEVWGVSVIRINKYDDKSAVDMWATWQALARAALDPPQTRRT